MYYVCEIRSKASSLGNARKRMGKSPPRYHRRNIFVSCGATIIPRGTIGAVVDGGINYSVGFNERAYYHPLFETGLSRGDIMRKRRCDRKEVAKTYIILEYELR